MKQDNLNWQEADTYISINDNSLSFEFRSDSFAGFDFTDKQNLTAFLRESIGFIRSTIQFPFYVQRFYNARVKLSYATHAQPVFIVETEIGDEEWQMVMPVSALSLTGNPATITHAILVEKSILGLFNKHYHLEEIKPVQIKKSDLMIAIEQAERELKI